MVGKTLHHLCNLLMADVIAKWQDGTATFLYLKLADVIAMWHDGKATFVLYMVDVIVKWQMELPLRVGDVLGIAIGSVCSLC